MKKYVVFILLLLIANLASSAAGAYHLNGSLRVLQDSIVADLYPTDSVAAVTHNASTLLDADGNVVDTTEFKLPNTYAWTIDTRFGDRTLAAMDTVRETFYRSVLVEGKGIAMNYLGNVGSPTQHVEYFKRGETSQFPFADVVSIWRRTPEKQLFLNTRVPYSTLHYQTGGGKEIAENHFKAELSSNFGKKLNVGFNFDYIYARGFYTSLFNKQISYDVNASYIGDRYKAHLFVGNNNYAMSDNGGIVDDRFITNPESEDIKGQRVRGSKDIPVVFQEGIKNRLRGRHIFLTNSYDLGKNVELVQIDDTTSVWRKKNDYIAPASVILTVNYSDQRRSLKGSELSSEIAQLDELYKPNIPNMEGGGGDGEPLYKEALNDYMSHYVLKNTLAFRMNEGFRSWTKFGLTAFFEGEMRRFLTRDGRTPYGYEKISENVWYVGGKLAKNQGKHFKFDVTFVKSINTNDTKLEGDVSTTFDLLGKEVKLRANAYVKNEVPGFFLKNFRFRNWVLDNSNFNDIKRVYAGGEISFPKMSFGETKVTGGYENVTDLIYWDENRKTAQADKNVNVLSLKLDQKFDFGIFHIDFQGLFQKSTEDKYLPLPLWTIYANFYLKTMVSKVLTFQLGVDTYMHAKYYVPGFDPIQMQFYNQREKEIGEFPHTNVYANLHLKHTRFFVMMYNVAETLGNRQSFTTLSHPVNPMMFRWGLSWKFNN